MELIKTKSFELAVNSKGDKTAEKLAIALPGRLDTKDYACFTSHLEYLADKGFYAISFDPPGTWESPGGIGLFTTTNYLKAVNELIDHFGNKQSFSASKSTLLLGHSMGGCVAMLAGTSNPAVESFVLINASFGPPSPPAPEEVQDGAIIDYRDLPPGTSETPEQKKFSLPLNFIKDGEQYDPLPSLKLCTKPKLIIYGVDDEYYSPQEVKEIYNSIPEPKMIHELNIGHSYRYHPEIVEEVNKILGQFIENIFKTMKTNDFYCDFVFSGKVEVKIVKESENVLAFYHTKPSWTTHIVIVPKKHVTNLLEVEDMDLIKEIFEIAREIIKENNFNDTNFRIITNGGEFQDSKHLHFHLVSGKPN